MKNLGSRDAHNAHADEDPLKPEEKKKHQKGVQRPLKHEGYDKHPGNGASGKASKKGGHGKGNWGDQDYQQIAKHHSVEATEELLDAEAEGMVKENQEAEGVQEEMNESEVKQEENSNEQKPKQHFKATEEEFPSLS